MANRDSKSVSTRCSHHNSNHRSGKNSKLPRIQQRDSVRNCPGSRHHRTWNASVLTLTLVCLAEPETYEVVGYPRPNLLYRPAVSASPVGNGDRIGILPGRGFSAGLPVLVI
ncbi:hypothetical protein RRG08_066177 [Elysia crispata]|uniref:Uncharacterized protein n=1 Tax=Elysia crispata TaxID=231223 RepID=A0AAE1D1A4_9GAST|nr:hypothetical protein RRG08_066177 [Elysia crispata]